MKSKFIILSFPFLLVSCIKVRDANKAEAQPETKQVVVEEKKLNPIVTLTPTEQHQKYLVKIQGLDPLSQITRKPLGVLPQDSMAEVEVHSDSAEDVISLPGLYEYSIQYQGQKMQLQVEVPVDYVIEGNKTLDQLNLDIRKENDSFRILQTKGRVFFRAGAGVITNGENFLIQANVIESEGARIQTFSTNQKADILRTGRHGGDIKLVAQSLRGTLDFVMRGEHGGDGDSDGITKRPEDVNNNGQNGGNSGLLVIEIEDQSKGRVSYKLEPGLGGQGVDVASFCYPLTKNSCKVPLIAKPKGVNGQEGIAQEPEGLN